LQGCAIPPTEQVHTDMIKMEIPCMSLSTWLFGHIDFNIIAVKVQILKTILLQIVILFNKLEIIFAYKAL
jgi:hypothetical protein